MKQILVIGIGAGNPEHLTLEAVNALNRVDVFFLMDKGPDKESLNRLRRDLCERYITHRRYRVVEAVNPERQREGGDYRAAVDALNAEKQRTFERLIADELEEGQCGALLVWGDPSLYDSTLRILDAIVKSGRQPLEYRVIPGITSVQALAAQHKVTLNSIGGSIAITTGRRLAEGFPKDVDSVVVMLDAGNAYHTLLDQNLDIFWGAYVGTPEEILIAGRLKDVADQIDRVRAQARQANGWIMDTYLLKRVVESEEDEGD